MIAHVIVTGRVQGVGFRFTVQQAAQNYGVTGWVRNKHDGSVEMEVSGETQLVKDFLKAVKAGLNPAIRVDDMNVEWQEDEKNKFKTFSIK